MARIYSVKLQYSLLSAKFLLDTGEGVYINWHQSRFERECELKKKFGSVKNETNLFIKNMKGEVTPAEMREAFSQFGEVTSVDCKPWTSPVGTKLKYGFVAYNNSEDAARACAEGPRNLTMKALFTDGLTYIGFFQSREQRAVFLGAQRRRQLWMPYGGPFGGFGGFGGFGMGMGMDMDPGMPMHHRPPPYHPFMMFDMPPIHYYGPHPRYRRHPAPRYQQGRYQNHRAAAGGDYSPRGYSPYSQTRYQVINICLALTNSSSA